MPNGELSRDPTGRVDGELAFEAPDAEGDLDRDPTGRVDGTLEFHAAGRDS